ncbi:MAG: S8 family peptidase [Phycisphaerales bacterium]
MFHGRTATPMLTAAAITLCLSGAAVAQDVIDNDGFLPFPVEGEPGYEYAGDRVLMRFAESVPHAQRLEIIASVGGTVLREYHLVPGLFSITAPLGVRETIQVLSDLPIVDYVEPDYITRLAATPNDTFFSSQYGLHNFGQNINGQNGIADADIDAPEAWDDETGDASVVVAILDTGILYTHPDLNDNIWANPGEVINGIDDDGNGFVDDIRGWDFHSGDNNPTDTSGHGTHTAGTVGAEGNNGQGVAGVMWDCQLMPVRILGSSGGTLSAAIAGIEYATDMGVPISNNSWTIFGFSNALANACFNARNAGHLMVCAAGNNGSNNDSSPFYPASFGYDNIISVAASDNRDNRPSFSNYGPVTVDLGAPGVDVASTWTGNNYVYSSGTSMASPHVAGAAGILKSAQPSLTYLQIRSAILDNVRPVASLSGLTVTGGVLNLNDALDSLGGSQSFDAPLVSFNITRGSLIAGNVNSIQHSDNAYLAVDPDPSNNRWVAQTVVRARSPLTTISTMDVSVEGHITSTNSLVNIFILNQASGRWMFFGTDAFNLTDKTISITNIPNASRFVNSSNGNIFIRVFVKKSNLDFDLFLDEVEVTVYQ